MHSQSGIFLPRVIHFPRNNNTVRRFILLTCPRLARVAGKANTENVFSRQLLTLHLTWETCGNLWHMAESAHTLTHRHTSTVCNFSFLCGEGYQPDWTLLRAQRTTCTQACAHTHTEVASGVGRNLEKALFPGEFPWMACLREQNNCSFTPSFHPSLHPSIRPGKRTTETLIHEPWVQWTDVLLGHFTGTLEHMIFDKHGNQEDKGDQIVSMRLILCRILKLIWTFS